MLTKVHEGRSSDHLPYEVKLIVKNCDITAHQYNQRTLIGASDSLLGFRVGHFDTMNINNYQLNPEWKDWIACQQMEPEPEPAAATYTSSEEDDGYDNNRTSLDNEEDGYNNNNDGYYDNYILRGLCGTGPVNQQDFTIQDAVNIGLSPKYESKGHCWICPLGCLYVPSGHPKRELMQEILLLFANKGTHPIYINLPFLNYHP